MKRFICGHIAFLVSLSLVLTQFIHFSILHASPIEDLGEQHSNYLAYANASHEKADHDDTANNHAPQNDADQDETDHHDGSGSLHSAFHALLDNVVSSKVQTLGTHERTDTSTMLKGNCVRGFLQAPPVPPPLS